MQILVTNDDGVYADGLWALVYELQDIGTVTVVAPDRDQSGVGTSVTLRQPLRLNKIETPLKGINAYSVEGTPADSVILALKFAIKEKVDLVVSGINEGPNLGNDVFISGTVGAALQGYFYGIPSIAISLAAFEGLHFNVATKVTRMLANAFNNGDLPRKLLLNINLPNLPQEEINGVEITKLGERSYTDKIDTGHDGKKQYYWIVRGIPDWNVNPGTDIWALEQNMISITAFPDGCDSSTEDFLRSLTADIVCKSSGIAS